MMTEQKCLEYIAKYRQEAITKYDFHISELYGDGAYVSLSFCQPKEDFYMEINGEGKTICLALISLINRLELPKNLIYKTEDFSQNSARKLLFPTEINEH